MPEDPEKRARRLRHRRGVPTLEEAVVWMMILQPVAEAMPEDWRERLEAGEDPQKLADECVGRILRRLTPYLEK